MAIGYALATALVLIALLLGFGFYTTLTLRSQQTRQARQAGVVRKLCGALYPDFTWPDNNRDTTQTFHLMLSGMLVFSLVLIIWAIGAGAMRAAWLLHANPMQLSRFGGVGSACVFIALQIVRATGGTLLICLAGGLAGGLFGFLFGIPHRIAENIVSPATGAGDKNNMAKSNYALSTNLTEVSDWLTKVIVGVSLVEAKHAYMGFLAVSTDAAGWLFEGRHGSPAVLAAALAGGAVFGFLFFYIYTQLILSRLIDAAQRFLTVGEKFTARLKKVDPTSRQLVPAIRRTSSPTDVVREPDAEDYAAALSYYGIPFNELIANPNVPDEQVLSWARACALLNDYESAVPAYFYLLGRESS